MNTMASIASNRGLRAWCCAATVNDDDGRPQQKSEAIVMRYFRRDIEVLLS